ADNPVGPAIDGNACDPDAAAGIAFGVGLQVAEVTAMAHLAGGTSMGRRSRVKVRARARGIRRAAIARLMDVEAVRAVRLEAADPGIRFHHVALLDEFHGARGAVALGGHQFRDRGGLALDRVHASRAGTRGQERTSPHQCRAPRGHVRASAVAADAVRGTSGIGDAMARRRGWSNTTTSEPCLASATEQAKDKAVCGASKLASASLWPSSTT